MKIIDRMWYFADHFRHCNIVPDVFVANMPTSLTLVYMLKTYLYESWAALYFAIFLTVIYTYMISWCINTLFSFGLFSNLNSISLHSNALVVLYSINIVSTICEINMCVHFVIWQYDFYIKPTISISYVTLTNCSLHHCNMHKLVKIYFVI